jgi:hypothetical protein
MVRGMKFNMCLEGYVCTITMFLQAARAEVQLLINENENLMSAELVADATCVPWLVT